MSWDCGLARKIAALGVPSRRGVAGSHSVARPQHRWCTSFGLAIVFALSATPAAAEPVKPRAFSHFERTPGARGSIAVATVPGVPTYRTALAFGYAIPATVALSSFFVADAWEGAGAHVFGVGLLGAYVGGPGVHALHRNPRAMGWAFLGNGLSMVGGFVTGAVIGGNALSTEGCADVSWCEMGNAFVRGLFGALGGSLVWGTFDVIYNAQKKPRRSTKPQQAF
ncbi:MAG TPA: hypothetical protein VHO25_11380 [Polyangiaceae bacterium]|nr:hypothetical protein [Polyangiaceae bacterium]